MKIDYASIFAQVKLETHYFSYLYMTLTFRNWPFVFVYIPQKLWKYRWKFLLAYLYYSHMNISCCNWIYKTAFILIYIINIYNPTPCVLLLIMLTNKFFNRVFTLLFSQTYLISVSSNNALLAAMLKQLFLQHSSMKRNQHLMFY